MSHPNHTTDVEPVATTLPAITSCISTSTGPYVKARATPSGGVALGLVPYEKVTAAMVETAKQAEWLFDKIAFCVHHPNADHPEMARCWCRKPKPELIIEASLDLARKRREMHPPYPRFNDPAHAEQMSVRAEHEDGS